MTFSIVARSGDGSQLAVATATATLCVGAIVPAVAPGAGAVATQAFTNRHQRAQALELLRSGLAPDAVLARLAAQDPGFARRQVGLVDAAGGVAAHTGAECGRYAGQLLGSGVVVVGNLVAGPEVLERMMQTYVDGGERPLGELLVDVLAAGEAAGGDLRGRQSAAVYVVSSSEEDLAPPVAAMDLRVDDHHDPVSELARLVRLHRRDAGDGAAPSVARRK